MAYPAHTGCYPFRGWRYSLAGNNCEHFVNWCATGAAVSQQVIAFLGVLVRMMTAAVWSMLAVFVARAVFAE